MQRKRQDSLSSEESISGSASPPALMFNSGMFSPTSLGSVTPPASHSVNNSPTPGGVSPPMFPTYSSPGSFSPFLPRQSYSNPTTYHPTTTSQSFQKFDPNVSKYEGSVQHYEQKFSGLQSQYDSARISKFEAKYEPNLSTEASQLSQQNRVGQTPDSLIVQSSQCGPIP